MKKIFRIALILGLVSTSLPLSAQDWGGGWGSGEDEPKKTITGKGGKSTNKEVNLGSSSASTPTSQPTEAPKVVIEAIGTHYDDAPQAHYEPEYVNQDTNLSLVQGDSLLIRRPYLRQADVKFRKRVWRVIDLRQKLNKNWTWPRSPITQVFWELGTKGLVRAYANDSFRRVVTPEKILEIVSSLDKVPVLAPGIAAEEATADDYVDSMVVVTFKYYDIKKFEIMEDWVFDYKHGEMKPIIIGIAPIKPEVIDVQLPDGTTQKKQVGESKPFWLLMDDCRPTLAKSQVFNRYNDAMRLNWDQQLNLHRLFDSYVVKQTDYDDLYISSKVDFKDDGVAVLLEAEKIKNDLFIFEHDLWEY
ncbi:MAG: gliding motility protein GldN [Bacteroidia bacterium]|nr:gliding motility protein GldN [Bacteroidia bacterium]